MKFRSGDCGGKLVFSHTAPKRLNFILNVEGAVAAASSSCLGDSKRNFKIVSGKASDGLGVRKLEQCEN